MMRYIKYAIGEIILVVVGILIALSINTWNESRKSQNFEKEMLSQIRLNLIKDKEALQDIYANGNKAVVSIHKILKLNSPQDPGDSIKYWLGNIIRFDRFQPLTNGYEVLKSRGLDQVTNKELRFLLGRYYDDQALYMDKAIQDIEWTFRQDWLPGLKNNVIEFRFKQYMELDTYDMFLENSTLRRNLIMQIDNYGGSIKYIKEGIELIDRILTLVDNEIDD